MVLGPVGGVQLVRLRPMILAEAGEALQEVLIFLGLKARVPGGVQTVVLFVLHADDVPGVIRRSVVVVGLAGDDTAVDARVIGQTVEQVGIALAHGLLLDGRGVGGVLRPVGGVVHVAVIVFDVGGDPVVDGLHLLVGGLAAEGQLGQDGVPDIVGQCGLLRGGGKPDGVEVLRVRGICEGILIARGERHLFHCAGLARMLPAQIVAGGTAALHVVQGKIPQIGSQREHIVSGAAQSNAHRLAAGHHLLAQIGGSLRFFGVDGACFLRLGDLRRLDGQGALPPRNADLAGIGGVDIRPDIGSLRRRGVRRQRLGRQQRQRQDQRQQQRGHALCHTFHVSPPLLVRLFYGVSLHRNLY